jgi:hypothetical protein
MKSTWTILGLSCVRGSLIFYPWGKHCICRASPPVCLRAEVRAYVALDGWERQGESGNITIIYNIFSKINPTPAFLKTGANRRYGYEPSGSLAIFSCRALYRHDRTDSGTPKTDGGNSNVGYFPTGTAAFSLRTRQVLALPASDLKTSRIILSLTLVTPQV